MTVTLTDVLTLLKSLISSPVWRVSKQAQAADYSLTIYEGAARPYRATHHSLDGRRYRVKPVQILIRWGDGGRQAEEKALLVYSAVENYHGAIGETTGWIAMTSDAPRYIGVTDNGKIEYMIEFLVYYRI